MRRARLLCTILATGVMLGGCLDYEATDQVLSIGPDLSGQATMSFTSIHSGKDTVEEQREEMRSFYDGEYEVLAAQVTQDMGWSNGQATLLNQTDLRCDARLTASFANLFQGLAGLLDGSDFEIAKSGDLFQVRIRPGASSGFATPNSGRHTFSIVYAGEIVEHNATSQNRRTRAISWNLGELTEDGIRFTLRAGD